MVIGCLLVLIMGLVYFWSPTPHEAVREIPTNINIKNPIGLFCGVDCEDCGHSVDQCLAVLKANLEDLCGEGSEQDCYGVWTQYAETCQYLCSKPMAPLTTATKMVNLVATDA